MYNSLLLHLNKTPELFFFTFFEKIGIVGGFQGTNQNTPLMHVDVAGLRCYVTFKLLRVRQVIRPMTPEAFRTTEGSDENVRNVIRHCLEFDND